MEIKTGLKKREKLPGSTSITKSQWEDFVSSQIFKRGCYRHCFNLKLPKSQDFSVTCSHFIDWFIDSVCWGGVETLVFSPPRFYFFCPGYPMTSFATKLTILHGTNEEASLEHKISNTPPPRKIKLIGSIWLPADWQSAPWLPLKDSAN